MVYPHLAFADDLAACKRTSGNPGGVRVRSAV